MARPRKTSKQGAGVEQPAGERKSAKGPSHHEREALARLGAELLRRAEESQPVLETAWNGLMASWGIHGKPAGIKRLRAMIQQESGANVDDNAFSRELIELRQERRS